MKRTKAVTKKQQRSGSSSKQKDKQFSSATMKAVKDRVNGLLMSNEKKQT